MLCLFFFLELIKCRKSWTTSMSAVTYEFCYFLHVTPYAGPAERHGSVLLACRRVTERYHMVSWQKYKVSLAVWSPVLNLNAKSDNWVRQEKKLSSKVLFISFCYFIFSSFFAHTFSQLPLSFLFRPRRKETVCLVNRWIQRGGGFTAGRPVRGSPVTSVSSLLDAR